MHVPGGNNAGPRGDIVWPDLMLEEQETLLEKKKANNYFCLTIFCQRL